MIIAFSIYLAVGLYWGLQTFFLVAVEGLASIMKDPAVASVTSTPQGVAKAKAMLYSMSFVFALFAFIMWPLLFAVKIFGKLAAPKCETEEAGKSE